MLSFDFTSLSWDYDYWTRRWGRGVIRLFVDSSRDHEYELLTEISFSSSDRVAQLLFHFGLFQFVCSFVSSAHCYGQFWKTNKRNVKRKQEKLELRLESLLTSAI